MADTRSRVKDAYFRTGGNISQAARLLGLSRGTVQYHLRRLKGGGDVPAKPIAGGVVHASTEERRPLPEEGEVARYIVTSAQNNTRVNEAVLNSLELLADHYGAEILVSRYTYNKSSYSQSEVKPGRGPTSDDMDELWYDERLLTYLCDERVQLAPGLLLCGEVNILPTAARPLSGFETYTGPSSGIFPHAKFAMESIATQQGERSKFNYTTGTVTLRNYIQKKAGQKADHHHCYGALLVEVTSTGMWYCRQLNATERGEIYDLDVRACAGKLTTGNRVEAVTWGDIHSAQLDQDVAEACWGEGGMLDSLRPRYQFCHDVFDMRARNHHDNRNPHIRFQQHMAGRDSVEEEILQTSVVLGDLERKWCETVVVNSNHDNALERWLREADYREDPANALFFLEAQLSKYRAIATGNQDFMLLEWALRRAGCPAKARFLREDESFVICPDARGGIECGMHGHLGPNGSRGTPQGLSRLGRKANTGHTHSAGIIDGMYIAGTVAHLDMGYNAGPSSWSHSSIVTYPNGKRAIVTHTAEGWRA